MAEIGCSDFIEKNIALSKDIRPVGKDSSSSIGLKNSDVET
jgi:hypothetical protein